MTDMALEVTDEMVRAFGEVLNAHGYDVAGFVRISPTEVRYFEASATPTRETVRAALAAALGKR